MCGGEWRTPILRILLLLWGHEAAVTSNAVPANPGSESISTDDRLHGCTATVMLLGDSHERLIYQDRSPREGVRQCDDRSFGKARRQG